MRRTLFALAVAALLAGACASPEDLGTDGAAIDLTIEREDGVEATLTCPEGAAAAGTGWLQDPAAAEDACDVVRSDPERFTGGGGSPGDVCTQQYGGPEEAEVSGVVNGETVAATFHRADGCGISDWDAFEPLVGSATGVREL